MNDEKTAVVEQIQRMVVRLVATHPAGQGLCLIGGFRYRFLDNGVRQSLDVDYHWDGDLGEKQAQLIRLFRRRLIPDVRRRLGCEGRADAAGGPDSESPAVKVAELAFWREGAAYGRVEIPVDITRIVCFDEATVRTADGVVYRTASDGDMIEGKILALFSRTLMEHRDLVDIFLFANHLGEDSPKRIGKKLATLRIESEVIQERLADFVKHRAYHVRAVDDVVSSQLDSGAAASIQSAGGGGVVLDAVLGMLRQRLNLGKGVKK